MYFTARAVREAGGAAELLAFNRSVSRRASVVYAFYRDTVLADTPGYDSRNIADLMYFAWVNNLVP